MDELYRQNGSAKHSSLCRSIREKVVLSLDNALSKEEENELMKEVENNPRCFDEMNIVKSYKEFLCNKARRHVNPNLVNLIKQKITALAQQEKA